MVVLTEISFVKDLLASLSSATKQHLKRNGVGKSEERRWSTSKTEKEFIRGKCSRNAKSLQNTNLEQLKTTRLKRAE